VRHVLDYKLILFGLSVDLAETALRPDNVVEEAQPADIAELAQATATSIARTLSLSRNVGDIITTASQLGLPASSPRELQDR
jgi:hypothetical protein